MGNRSASNPVGRAALAMAVLTCVFQVFGQAVLFVLLGPGNLGGAFAIVGWIGMGGTLCAVVAMVLGIVGLNKPGAAKGAAGVGLGVGAYVVLTSVVQMLSNMILTYA